MSVAFRRESDEEHREPRFELPIPAGPNLVTARGLVMMGAKVTELQARVARETDESALAAAQRELRYWSTRQTTAHLAPPPPADRVAFGARVTIDLGGIRRTIDIVGPDEADPTANRIAFQAPLARVLIGASVGDLLDFGGQVDAIEVLAIDRPD